ncbi:hypothetical protein KHQ81_07190 [Mycoplasmatota bacterium]|nr:hypothetical protein KHQ81_07190 [Mycoplasmatota bacterium]
MINEKIITIYNKGKIRFYFRRLIIALFLSIIGLGGYVSWEYLKSRVLEDNSLMKQINVLEILLFYFIVFSLWQIIVASKQWKEIKSQFNKLQKEKKDN